MTTTPLLSPEVLRQRAEELFQADEKLILEPTTPEEKKLLFHELRVHQIQLEMQNEELRRAQADLDASEARYFDLYDLTPVGCLTLDVPGMILEANLAAAAMLGVAKDKLVNQPINKFLFKEDQDLFYLRRQQAFKSNKPQVSEILLKRPDGSSLWAKTQATLSAGGEFWMVMSDISERKKAEEALEARTEELRTENRRMACILAGTQAGTWEWNIQTSEIIFNEQWAGIIGYSLEELSPVSIETWMKYAHPDDLQKSGELLEKHFRGELEFYECECRMKHKNGQWVWVMDRGKVALWTDNGKPSWMFGTHHNIMERKQAEDELHHAKVAAETANIAKNQFLSTMSHEIRTPMNSVLGAIQMLQQGELTQEEQELTEIAIQSGVQLVALINDILDLAKIEAGKIELEIADFNLASMISDTINILSLQAREKGLLLTASQDRDVPPVLKGDAGRLRQILINLIGNAIKFTQKGKITLHIQKEREDIHSVTLCFLVRDSGIGIAADKLEHIFDPFTQADCSTTRRYGGTGLGLAICKQFVELMGGTIGAESRDGGGSAFRFTVVLEKQAEVPSLLSPIIKETHREPFSVAGVRILFAEDDPTAQKIVPRLLKSYGCLVDVVSDGKEALQALEKNDYALVLMDCMMPGMNGYEVTTVIRDPVSPVRRHDIPVIALTGNAMKQDRGYCLAAGMNDHLPKPLLFPDLLAMLEKYLKGGTRCL